MVTMAMVSILKISNPKCTTTHPKDNSFEISLQSDLKYIFKLSWLPWQQQSF